MEWLLQHAEAILAIGFAILTFASWNFSQGWRLKQVEKELVAQEKKIEAIEKRQTGELASLMAELKSISVKLAHIEGFLHAESKRPTPS